MGNVQMVPPSEGEGTSRRNFYVVAIYGLWGSDLGRPRSACPDLSAVPAQSEKGRRVDRDRRHRAHGAELAGGADLPAHPHRRVEGDQRKEHRLGGQDRRQPGDGLRAAVHAPGVRLPLGRRQGRVSLSLPHVAVLHRRQGDGRAGAAAAGPLPDQAERQQAAARQTAGSRRRRSRETPHPRGQRVGGSSHRHPDRGAPVPLRRDSGVQRLAPGVRQRRHVPVHGAGIHRRAAGVQLRAHAGRCLQQPALHPDGVDRRAPDARAAPLGREHDDRGGGAAHGAGLPVRGVQEAARSHLDGGRGAAAAHAGVRADRVPAAVGQPGLLGNRGHHADRGAGAGAGAVPVAIAGRRRRDRRGDVRALLRTARAAAAAGHGFPDRAARLPGAQARRGAAAGRRVAAQEEVLPAAGLQGYGRPSSSPLPFCS